MTKVHKLHKVQHRAKKLLSKVYIKEEKILVFGEGNVDAKIVMVGEAPGEKETLLGHPFVGKAGENLNEFLRIIGLNRADIYITNIVKFRPYKINKKTGRLSNRPPTRAEIDICHHILVEEMEIIRPKVVVTLGNTSLRGVLGDKSITIGSVHAMPLNSKLGDAVFKVYPLYHPASIIYNPLLRETYISDIKKLAEWIKQVATNCPEAG